MAIDGGTVDISISAYGSPRFVALAEGSAAVAGVIGTAIKQSSIYDACMQANGFTPAAASEPVATAPSLYAVATTPPNPASGKADQPPPVAAPESPTPSGQGVGPDPEFQWAPSASISFLGN